MDEQHLLDAFSSVRRGAGADGKSLAKPILLIVALERCWRSMPRLAEFLDYECLVARAGELSQPIRLQYPFGRLVGDGLWEIEGAETLTKSSSGDLSKRELYEKRVRGGFPSGIYDHLSRDKSLLLRITSEYLLPLFSTEEQAALRASYSVFAESPSVSETAADYTQREDSPGNNSVTSVLAARSGTLVADPPERRMSVPAETDLRDLQRLQGNSPQVRSAVRSAENGFIAYLNSLHNVGAAGANALAESQALNSYFAELYEPFPIIEDVLEALRGPRDCVVVLTGHAGDGKSTVALDVLKRLRGLPLDRPLDQALGELESVNDAREFGRTVSIVKDMSELSADRRLQWLQDAFGTPGSWLIVSNTGPLLNSLREFADRRQVPGDIESKILEQLDRPYVEGQVDGHILSEFPKDLVIVNMTRLDNVRLGARVLTRMVAHSGWSQCANCGIEPACPLLLNRRALAAAATAVEEHVRWLYRRLTAYEQRLTLRQMVAHLAYSMTGGMTCAVANASVERSAAEGMDRGTDGLEGILFSEGFFGYRKGAPAETAGALRAVELIRRTVFGGPVGVDYERQLARGEGSHWASLPETLVPLARRWAGLAQEAAGVRWRFAQRRMLYLFGQAKPAAQRAADAFIDRFLQSPRLRDFDRWIFERALMLSPFDKKRLLNACLRVLLETYSGFSAGQFDSRSERLYLTLRRPDRAVVQPTQLVMAIIDFDELDLGYDAARRLPLLEFRDGVVRLPLTLPLLDYIERRHAGNLGGELAQIHLAQLEWFRAELLRVAAERDEDGEIRLLRAGVDGQVHLHRYLLDVARQTLEVLS